jgi:alpha 1,2-mannosyltransferase
MRGIVTSAGGPLYFLNAYLNFRLLREKGCTLPFEWFYLGAEMRPAWIKAARTIPNLRLENLGGTCTDCAKGKGGWQSKIEAILGSRFDELLFLDADCFPIRDPEYLFDELLFKKYGAVLWPDVWQWADDHNPHVAGSPGKAALEAKYDIKLPSQQVESGQLLFCKRKCAGGLTAVQALNRSHEDTYGRVFGDKDTFLIGFLQARADFVCNPHPCEAFRGGLRQKDFQGDPLFCHLTGAKFQRHGRPLVRECDLPGASQAAAISRDLIKQGVL